MEERMNEQACRLLCLSVCFVCCPGISSVDFDADFQHITAMRSLEGEVVPLRNLIRISNDVEVRRLRSSAPVACVSASLSFDMGWTWMY